MVPRLARHSQLIRRHLIKTSVAIHPKCSVSHRKYMTAPLAIAGGMVASSFGTYWALRNHLNPIKARPLDQLMQARMVGEYLSGSNLEIKLSPIDTAMQTEIREKRADTIKKIRQRFEFQFLTGNCYLRPIVLDEAEGNNKDIDTGHLFKEYGICHAFWILNAGPVDYLLDFIREGIRFEMVEMAHQTMQQHPDIYVPAFKSPLPLNVQSYKLMDFLEDKGTLNEKANLNEKYCVNNNHCLHFVDKFGQHFRPDLFHPDRENQITSFNTGYKQKSNEELLKWTKSVIDSR